jgi:hypothetical protein
MPDSSSVSWLLTPRSATLEVIGADAGRWPGAVDEDRLVRAWAYLFRLAVEHPA